MKTSKKRDIHDNFGHMKAGLGPARRLTADEEKDLARRAKAGDREARDTLILCNTGLAIMVLNRWAMGYPGRPEQYLGAAFEALIRGIDRFDPGRGRRLSTYLFAVIRRRLTCIFRNEGTLIRVPCGMHDVLCRVEAGKPAGHRRPDKRRNSDLIDSARIALKAGAVGCAASRGDIDRGFTHGVTGMGATMYRDLIDEAATPDGPEDSPFDVAPERLRAAVDRLEERHRGVIVRRFGLDGSEPSTLREIGRHFGVSKERVRQIEAEAMASLRRMLSVSGESNLQLQGVA